MALSHRVISAVNELCTELRRQYSGVHLKKVQLRHHHLVVVEGKRAPIRLDRLANRHKVQIGGGGVTNSTPNQPWLLELFFEWLFELQLT